MSAIIANSYTNLFDGTHTSNLELQNNYKYSKHLVNTNYSLQYNPIYI